MKINVRIDGLPLSILEKIDNNREKSTPISNLFNSDDPEVMMQRGGSYDVKRRGSRVGKL